MSYSWGEFYETAISCSDYKGDVRFEIFEKLDTATSLEKVRKIVNSLTEEQINWLNSPCLDGLILCIKTRDSNDIAICQNQLFYIRDKIPSSSLLHILIKETEKDYSETCKYLLTKGFTKRCLMRAVQNRNYAIIETFLKLGANVHYNRDYPLIWASSNGDSKTVKLLLKYGADIHARDDLAIQWASQKNYAKTLKILLKNGANINTNSLLRAADFNSTKTLKILLENGVDIHTDDDRALQIACENGCEEAVKILVEHGANIHANNDGCILHAVRNGHLQIVKFLLENGADIHSCEDLVISQVPEWDDINDTLDMMKILAEYGANIHAGNEYALKTACVAGDIIFVKNLIQKGADARNDNYISPLSAATQEGHTDIVEFLIKNGATVKEQLNKALDIATENGNIGIIKLVIEAGAKYAT
jgi:ankyrin repeat protein